jgi:hypothetical protein
MRVECNSIVIIRVACPLNIITKIFHDEVLLMEAALLEEPFGNIQFASDG